MLQPLKVFLFLSLIMNMDSLQDQIGILTVKLQEFTTLAQAELKSRSDLVVKFLHQNPYTKDLTVAVKANYQIADKFVRNYDYESVDWKLVIGIAIAVIFCWETFLEIRQRFALGVKKLPTELVGVTDQKTFDKSRTYNIEKWNFKLFNSFYGQVQNFVFIYYNLYAVLWYNIEAKLAIVGYNNHVVTIIPY